MAQEQVRFFSDLEVVSGFPKGGGRTRTARAKLSPNLTYSGIEHDGRFEPKMPISVPPTVDPFLGFTRSITEFRPSAVSSSPVVLTV